MNQYCKFLSKSWYIPIDFFGLEDDKKTELPTEQKKQKARKEGQVLRSNEINSAVSLLVLFSVFFFMLSYFSYDLILVFKEQINKLPEITNISVYSLGFAYIRSLLGYIVFFLLTSFIINFLINILQVGFLITFKPITPKWDRIGLNFSKWVKNSFFSFEALFNLFKSLIKIVTITLVYYVVIKSNIGKISRLPEYNLNHGIFIALSLAYKITFFSVLLLFIISIFDYLFQRFQYIKKLKMTKEEVKQEKKETEGDPLLRTKIREKMRDIFLNSNLRESVPKSDVVITNPEHFAIAIKWDSNTMYAPVVIAKGKDKIAFTIKQIAYENNIPIMEDKLLARALYINVKVNEAIPREYWELVSKILVKVYSITKKFR